MRPSDKLRRVLEVRPFGQAGAATINSDGSRTEHMALVAKGMAYTFRPGDTVQRQLTPAELLELDAYLETMPGVFRA